MQKRTLLSIFAVLFLGLAILLIPQFLHLVPSVQAASKTVTLIGSVSGWNSSQSSGTNPTITVAQGDTVMVKLSSVDLTHQFALDVDKDGTSFMDSCPSGDTCSPTFSSTSSVTIIVNFAPGTYTYFCTFHSSMVGSFVVQTPEYSLAPTPSSLSIQAGSIGTSTITLKSLNGFTGTVGLSTSVSPGGPIASLNPTSVSLTSGSSGTSMLSVSTSSTPRGSYSVTVSGNGTGTHIATISVTVTVPDFQIATNPSSLSVTQNSTSASTITLSSLDGFSGTLNLTATVSPSGPNLSFTTASVILSSGGTAQSTLTVSAIGGPYNTVATGMYTVTLTVTNGTLSHSKTLQATVNPLSSPISVPPLPLADLAIAGVVIAAAVAVTIFLVRRGRTPSKQPQAKP